MDTMKRCNRCGKTYDMKNNYCIEFFDDNDKLIKVYNLCDKCYKELEKWVRNIEEKENEK